MKKTRRTPENLSDRFALSLVKFLRFFADSFFKKRYGHRAVVLETVAAVPGMVGGALIHFKSLRRIQDDKGWIEKLLAEAHNERMHLMTFVNIAQPNKFERLLIVFVQIIFVIFYGLFYIISPKTAHRFVGHLEEEAVLSYTQYLEEIESGRLPNVPAPKIAIEYWDLNPNATLRDVVLKTRKDEEHHRDANHAFSDQLL
jgi:ubiquinol oxidase